MHDSYVVKGDRMPYGIPWTSTISYRCVECNEVHTTTQYMPYCGFCGAKQPDQILTLVAVLPSTQPSLVPRLGSGTATVVRNANLTYSRSTAVLAYYPSLTPEKKRWSDVPMIHPVWLYFRELAPPMLAQSRFEIVDKTPQGNIVHILFSGFYPSGGRGNKHATEMSKYVQEVVNSEQPAAVLLDLRDLDYDFGDALGGIVLPTIEKETRKQIPSCVLAHKSQRRSLKWFFEPNVVWGLLGLKLFHTLSDAIEHLRSELTKT